VTAVTGRRPRGGLLSQRNFRLLWTGETVSTAGNAMATVGVPLLAVTVLHASTFAVAALTAAAYLPWLVIGLPAGAWVDRLPPRPLMVTCDVIPPPVCRPRPPRTSVTTVPSGHRVTGVQLAEPVVVAGYPFFRVVSGSH